MRKRHERGEAFTLFVLAMAALITGATGVAYVHDKGEAMPSYEEVAECSIEGEPKPYAMLEEDFILLEMGDKPKKPTLKDF